MLEFTSKYFPSTGKKYSHRYQVPAETECFVWLARNHTLYPGSWSKWKLPLNKITSGDVQQAKTVNAKTFTAIFNKTEFVYSLWRVSRQYRINFFPTSALKNVHLISRKLYLDQTSHMLKNIAKTIFFKGKTTGWLRVGTWIFLCCRYHIPIVTTV